jgi:manganese/zinc/iron transport system substrate-binding protein
MKRQLHAIPPDRRYLVTSHDAFNYFARAYLAEEDELADGRWHERFAAPEGLAPDSQLSTTDIQAIINHLDTYHILVLFPESNVSKDSIRKIVDAGAQKGLHLTIADGYLYADAMGPVGSDGDTYLKMIAHNAALIAKYLDNNGKEARAKALQQRGSL